LSTVHTEPISNQIQVSPQYEFDALITEHDEIRRLAAESVPASELLPRLRAWRKRALKLLGEAP